MSTIVAGVVTNGLIVPAMPLREGAQVEIHLQADAPKDSTGSGLTPSELRKLPREQLDAILAKAAALAEWDYCNDKELTGFDAFSEECDDDSE